jgi:hypothetical protein
MTPPPSPPTSAAASRAPPPPSSKTVPSELRLLEDQLRNMDLALASSAISTHAARKKALEDKLAEMRETLRMRTRSRERIEKKLETEILLKRHRRKIIKGYFIFQFLSLIS